MNELQGTKEYLKQIADNILLSRDLDEKHKDTHKCIWENINNVRSDISIVKSDLYNETEGKEGLYIKYNRVKEEVFNIQDYIKAQKASFKVLSWLFGLVSLIGVSNVIALLSMLGNK